MSIGAGINMVGRASELDFGGQGPLTHGDKPVFLKNQGTATPSLTSAADHLWWPRPKDKLQPSITTELTNS